MSKFRYKNGKAYKHHSISVIPYERGQYEPFCSKARLEGWMVGAGEGAFFVHHPDDAKIRELAEECGLQIKSTEWCLGYNGCKFDKKRQ